MNSINVACFLRYRLSSCVEELKKTKENLSRGLVFGLEIEVLGYTFTTNHWNATFHAIISTSVGVVCLWIGNRSSGPHVHH
jgi:hypothetical protein